MKKARMWCIVLFGVFWTCGVCSADEPSTTMKISGQAALDLGQIRSGSMVQLNPAELTPIQDAWQECFLYRLKYDFTATERMRMILDIEGQISFSYPQILNPIESQSPRFLFNPERLEGMYSFVTGEPFTLQLGIGYFPFKFNPDATNLGELLFRSGTYPLWVITNFDHCYGKLLGLRLSGKLFGCLSQDLLFSSEALMFPTQDYSLSYVLRYSLAHVVDVNAGVSLSHLLSTDEKLTSGKGETDDMYIKENGDTAYFNFFGIKPSAVLSFDPKPLLPSGIADFLGKKDGRIWGEVFVSGWEDRKNYDSAVLYDTTKQMKQYYANRLDRTVVAFGCDIPTFKLLDILALEFEHFPNRYPNSYRNVIERNIATPFLATTPKQFPWKWSLYAKKSIGKFFLVGQIARDHMRITFPDIKISEKEDQLKFGKDWWWVTSFGFAM